LVMKHLFQDIYNGFPDMSAEYALRKSFAHVESSGLPEIPLDIVSI